MTPIEGFTLSELRQQFPGLLELLETQARSEALEEAAREVERQTTMHREKIAAAIRALKK